jgi:hypothetical protein
MDIVKDLLDLGIVGSEFGSRPSPGGLQALNSEGVGAV